MLNKQNKAYKQKMLRQRNKAFWTDQNPYLTKQKKKCWLCHKIKSNIEFGKNSCCNDGLMPKCKPCHTEYIRNHHIKNPAHVMVQAAKVRAKKKGLVFNITYRDIKIPTHCPILGIKLEVANNIHNDGSPTLDRINNNLGYTLGNIQVISFKANTIKNNATIEELEKIINYMKYITHHPHSK